MNQIDFCKLRTQMVDRHIAHRGVRAALLEASAVTPLRSQELKGLPDTYPFGL